jgi:signal transduction histidine kinase/HPt (histidine-containing phosphotransfer) domain-containing protein/ActR/RegA family two-component response regulator
MNVGLDFTSLRFKLFAGALLTSLMALVIAGTGLFFQDLKGYRESSAASLAVDAQLLGYVTSAALEFDDRATARQNLQFLRSRPTVRTAAIYGVGGKLFAQYVRDGLSSGELPASPKGERTDIEGSRIAVYKPIRVDGERVGYVYLSEDLAVGDRVASYTVISLAVMLAALLGSALFAAWLQRSVTRPLIDISDLARRVVDTRDYSLRATPSTRDEIATLVEAFNEMLAEIERRTADMEASREEVVRLNRDLELRVSQRTAQLVESNLQLREANQAKSSFLSMMSHEIRTPMNGVLGMLELLSLGQLDPSQRSTLEVVRSSSRALVRIIDDILDFSKIEAGKLEIRSEPTSIAEVVARVVGIYSGNASSKALVLRSRIDARLRPVMVDPVRLQQVLNNLVSNAIKFTQKGSVEIDVQLLERRENEDVVRISVHDTGIGIDPEQKARLFQPFVQAQGVTRTFGGTGLGLSIGQRLAALMGGSIEIESEPGRGTSVHMTLVLPLAPERAPGPAAVDAPVVTSGPPEGRRAAPSLAEAEEEGTLVLVVDDHPINRMLLMRQISVLGYASVTADDGRQALDLWRSGRFRLVITDCNMPEMDGYELARAIRDEERKTAVPRTVIIACTANALKGEADHCFEAGMDDYIAKPVELGPLSVKLDQWLPIPSQAAGSRDDDRGARGADVPAEALDPRVLEGLSGGDPAAAREIIAQFVPFHESDVASLRSAFNARDMAAIAQFAHRIKGASGAIGAATLAAICEVIEHAARAGNWEAVQSAWHGLGEQLERLDGRLAEVVKNGA